MTHRTLLTCAHLVLSVLSLGCHRKDASHAVAGAGGAASMGSEGGAGQNGMAAPGGAAEGPGGLAPLGCEEVLGDEVDVTHLPSCDALAFEGSGASAGALVLRGHVTDLEGLPIVGARVELTGDANAVRYSDLTGGYGFRVEAGTYALGVTAECDLPASSVELTALDTDTIQNFEATGAGCLVPDLARPRA